MQKFKMKNLSFLIAVCLLFSCAEKKEAGKESFDLSAVKNHIIEMNKTYSDRFVKNDTAFYHERYCIDAEVYSQGVPAVKGRDSIISFFYQNGTNKEAKIELPTGNFYGSSELVVEEGLYNFPDGKGGNFDKGKFIALWKQEGGKWKLYREIWNSDNPPIHSK
jgi:ketosteroid isomerase-like protein